MFSIDQIFKDSPSPTYIKDEQGKIVWANKAYALLHRTSLDILIENGSVDFDFSSDRDLEILTAGGEFKVEEFYKLEDGRGAWFLTVKKAIELKSGERFLLSTSTEIKNLKETLQSAEDTFATKEKFLADVSQELDAPIHAMISLLKLLKRTYVSKDQKRYLNTLLSITDYLLEVPKDILEYARVEAGKLDLGTEVFDIIDFVNGALELLTPKAAEQDVAIHFSEPVTKLPLLEINPSYLNLILVRLINCLIRYTSCKDIVVSVYPKDRLDKVVYLQFSIKCAGIELDIEDLGKLFDFEARSNDEKRFRDGNVDLGVYICKKLISLQGGKLWLDNRATQGGSIEFVLPFSINQKSVIEQNYKEDCPEQLKKLQILLVEDNESSQLLVKHQIQFWDIKIDIASNGEEGVKLAAENAYDLILMDVEMPVMDGFEATSLIRSQPGPDQKVPIIAFTANSINVDLEEYRRSGFSDYLLKPYHTFDLYLCISKNVGYYSKDQSALKQVSAKELQLYDFSGLGNLAEDSVFIHKMQKLFVELVPEQLEKLMHAIQQKDWEAVALIAHSLKSTYGNIKVVKAAAAMKEIEGIARSGANYSEICPLMETVKEITQRVIDVFCEELAISL